MRTSLPLESQVFVKVMPQNISSDTPVQMGLYVWAIDVMSGRQARLQVTNDHLIQEILRHLKKD